MHDPLVWIDCEMTGLSLVDDALIEVAVIVTDYQLQPLDKGIDLLIKPSEQALEQMNDFVRNMHTHSGLLEQLAGPEAMDMENATAEVLAYIKRLVPQERTALLAGNSVGNDKNFLARDMPEVIEHLHYRIIDVSTIKELAKHWYPRPTVTPRKRPATTAPWATSLILSMSCATTVRPYLRAKGSATTAPLRPKSALTPPWRALLNASKPFLKRP